MRRREFIAGIGTAVLPFAARAQQAKPVVGFLRSASRFPGLEVALREGLKEAGFIDGQNVAIEYRYADNQISRLPALAAELIRLPVAVLVANSLGAVAARPSAKTTPVVFASGSDPVKDGHVPSLNRPGGNVTGVIFFGGVVGSKRLALLRQLVPNAPIIAMVLNPDTDQTTVERNEVLAAARTVGLQLVVLEARTASEVERAVVAAKERGAGALLFGSGAFMNSQRERLVALAARHALPAMHFQREFTELGGLMSYGSSQSEAYRQAGIYAGRILKGEKPGDLPVVQSTKFEFVINLKTAKTLGLEFHPQLLATADEVIE